ncbi:MAG: HAMP domain-containing histidine kinase [Peptococcaceae bacterium]|jgi:heavy metal sensor kinase|nr:HAMP domain-containing histidine kinase [Peptococcaceae bacterium]
MRHSLRARLSLTILLAVLLVIALVSVFANLVINRQFEAYIEAQETARSRNIAADLSGQWDGSTGAWNLEYIHALGMYSLYDGYILKIYDSDGDIIWDAENHDMSLCGQIMSEITVRMDIAKKSGDFTAHTFELEHGGQRLGAVVINYYGPYFYSETDFRFIKALNTILVYIGIAAAAVAVGAGLFLARRITRPLAKTAEAARRISKGDYAARLENETDTRELSDLVSAINYLSEALAEQEKLRQRLTADVAHELRTPLTSVGAHLDAMIEGLWQPTKERLQSCREEVLRLGSLVNDLARLAKADSDSSRLNLAPVDLLEVVRNVAPAWEAAASQRGVKLTVGGAPVAALADKDRLAQVVTNLLSNAVKYTPADGHIEVSVHRGAGIGVIEVSDDGVGIPESDLPFIFERFYRADKSRGRGTGGAGIGLAIVKSIVAAHGGAVAAASEGGKGSRFTVTLPEA